MPPICCRMDIADIRQLESHYECFCSRLKEELSEFECGIDLWKGEADAQAYIPDMIERLKKEGYAHVDDGALVIDVQEETDTKEIPPCMIQKSRRSFPLWELPIWRLWCSE